MSSVFTKRFKSTIDPEWEKTINPLKTNKTDYMPVMCGYYEVSPPFPSHWFPNQNSSLYYYVYALLPGHVLDGVLLGNIWARIEVAVGKKDVLKIVRMADEVCELGIQGFWMLKQEEVDIYRQVDRAEAYLKSLTAAPDENSEEAQITKQYYRLWISCNGVLEEEIRPRHEEFFRWVNNSKKLLDSPRKWWQWWKT